MTVFVLTDPDTGKKYKVTADTAEAAYAAWSQMLGKKDDGTASMATPTPSAPMDGPLPPPRADAPGAGSTPPIAEPDTFGGPALAMMKEPLEAAGRYGAGIMDTANSPSYQALRRDVPAMHPALAATLSKFGDVGMGGLSLLGAGVSGAAGLVTEAIPGLSDRQEEEVARSGLLATQFAVPELAGVSSVTGIGARASAAPAAGPAATPVAKAAVKTAKIMTAEEVNALANKAGRGGMGSTRAREKLAVEARLNPEAKAAADRLGIELPADVFSDNPMVQEAAGQTRGIAGSDPSAAWINTVNDAKAKADEIIEAMDGSPDLASLSDEVKTSVTKTRNQLEGSANALYQEVDAAVPPSTPTFLDNSVMLLNKIVEDLGGTSNLTAEEKRLFNMVTNPNERPTYAAIQREKTAIGTAIGGKKKSVYDGSDVGLLKRIYGALSEDQKATIASVGDATLVSKLEEANALTGKQKRLEERITEAYGGDLDGSIGMKLRTALSTGSKGDITVLNRIMNLIPEDLRGKAMMTALSTMSRQASGAAAGTFGLPQFYKMWTGIQQNKPVFNMIGAAIGPERMAVLEDLAMVTGRINKSSSYVLGTGKANQALASILGREGLISRLAQSTVGQRGGRAAGAAAGAAVGGVGGAIVGSEAVGAVLMGAKSNVLSAVGKMFNSNEFLKAATEAATKGKISPATAVKLSESKAFADWAKAVGRAPVDLISELTGIPKAGVPAVGATAAQPTNEKPWMQLEGRY